MDDDLNIVVENEGFGNIISEVSTEQNCTISMVEFNDRWEIWVTECSNIETVAMVTLDNGLNEAIRYFVYWIVQRLKAENILNASKE